MLTPDEWRWIRDEIIKDKRYAKITVTQLDEIISNGVKGRYDKFPQPINATTIFNWIEKWIKITYPNRMQPAWATED